MIRALTVLALVSPSIAFADAKTEAQAHIDKATQLFEAGKAEEAIVELKDAYALDPRPELLYALGQAHASLGQCDKAKVFYERFAKAKPKDTALATEAIAACKDAPPPVKVEPPPPPPKKIEPPPPPPPPEIAPWYTDTIGLVLVGSGLVLGGVGAFEYRAASKARKDATGAGSYDEFLDGLDDETKKRKLGLVFSIAGGVVFTAGVAKLVFHKRTKEPSSLELGKQFSLRVTPTRDGAAASVFRRF